MKFGFFDDAAMEYIIQTPKTPLPWINYLGCEDFFSLISNTGGGYSFYRDAKLRRLTRYRYNNVPTDLGGRCYYIKDGQDVWSPTFLPCKTPLDDYRCRHGLGYTIFESSLKEVQASLTCFVPLGHNCEVNSLTVKNLSDAPKALELYGAIEWCLWNAVDDAQNFQRNLNIGEVEVENGVIYHKTEYRERRNHYGFYGVNQPTSGFETDRDTFLGQLGSWDMPQVVASSHMSNSLASGWSPIAAHKLELNLAPGEERNILFVLGYVELPPSEKWEAPGVINKAPAHKLLEAFSTQQSVQTALEALAAHWNQLLGNYQLSSPEEKLNRMVNIWNQYQTIITYNLSRSASYYESGLGRGMGFRDSCQDILGFVHMLPEGARQRILDLAAIQLEDGSTYHQYQPLTKRGNSDIGQGFNDDPLWLVACTAAYIKETGDHSILDELVPFDNDEKKSRPLMEHLRRSIGYTWNHRGPHGLPLIGRADWNDCLNLNCFSEVPGESFQTCSNFESGKAESVFIAAMFVLYGREYAELCRRFGDEQEAAQVLGWVNEMEQTVLTHGWDGDWFLRAYDAFSNKVGSSQCEEGRIFIEPQGFCVMAGIGVKEGLAAKALASVGAYLQNDYGIELLNPCYTRYHKELGEITSYPPGYKENGSIFCHSNPWITIAHTLLGDAERAYETYKLIAPAFAEKNSEVRRTEPYVYSQTIAGRSAPHYGEAKNSWLTGTAAWAFVSVSQHILGIRPDYDGLMIDPRPPACLSEYTVTRRFRGALFHIKVHNQGAGQYRLLLDGQPLPGRCIPLQPGRAEYQVEVFI